MTPKTAYDYRGMVLRWIDGDTVDVRIDLGFEVSIVQRVRLYGVNTPEMRSSDAAQRTRAKTALSMCQALAPEGCFVQLRTHKSNDKYGRYLASLITEEGEDVSFTLISKGLGVEYFGGKRE